MQFFEDDHKYVNNSETYISVSTLLKKLEPQKDWDDIAKKYAKKNNLSVAEVKAMWELEKNNSIVRGKRYHAISEAQDLKSEFAAVFSDPSSSPRAVFAPEIINGIKIGGPQTLEEGIYPELLVWLNSLKIAGQIDRCEIVNNTVNIIDYKTNKKIETTSFVNRQGLSEKMLFPCSHLDNCNYYKYALQLNFYAYIVLRNNPYYTLGKMILKHIKFENPENPSEATSVEDYILPDLQKEIYLIAEAYKNNQLK